MEYVSISFLPILIFIWLPVSFLITYVLAVKNGHVYPLLPSISATGTLPPESCWFGIFTNIASFLSIAGYIRHEQVSEFARCRPASGPRKSTNRLATLMGIFSVAGLIVLANWQVTNVTIVHSVGATCCCYSGIVYFIFQTVFSFWMAPEMNSFCMFMLRAFLILLMVALFVVSSIAAKIALQITDLDVMERLQWHPPQPGWRWHLLYSVTEWALMLVFAIYFLTYYPDFKRIGMEVPVLKMKRKWMNKH